MTFRLGEGDPLLYLLIDTKRKIIKSGCFYKQPKQAELFDLQCPQVKLPSQGYRVSSKLIARQTYTTVDQEHSPLSNQ